MHCLDAYKEPIGSYLAGRGLNLLVTSLSKYADYLVKQCDAVKRVHSSVCQISEILSFAYLPLCQAVSPCFHQHKQKLKERSLFEYLLVEDICPAEPRKKYEYIQNIREVGLLKKLFSLLTR